MQAMKFMVGMIKVLEEGIEISNTTMRQEESMEFKYRRGILAHRPREE